MWGLAFPTSSLLVWRFSRAFTHATGTFLRKKHRPAGDNLTNLFAILSNGLAVRLTNTWWEELVRTPLYSPIYRAGAAQIHGSFQTCSQFIEHIHEGSNQNNLFKNLGDKNRKGKWEINSFMLFNLQLNLFLTSYNTKIILFILLRETYHRWTQ